MCHVERISIVEKLIQQLKMKGANQAINYVWVKGIDRKKKLGEDVKIRLKKKQLEKTSWYRERAEIPRLYRKAQEETEKEEWLMSKIRDVRNQTAGREKMPEGTQ